MRALVLLLTLFAASAFAADGSVRFELAQTGEGPHGMGPAVVIVCSDERFVLDSKAMIDPDTPLRRYLNVTVCRDGKNAGSPCGAGGDCPGSSCELKPTPGGAIIWSTWPTMDFVAMCPKAGKRRARP